MLKATDIPVRKATPFRISHKIGEAGTVAGNPTGVVSGVASFAYYFISQEEPPPRSTFILATDYPVLAAMWGSDADDIYDDV